MTMTIYEERFTWASALRWFVTLPLVIPLALLHIAAHLAEDREWLFAIVDWVVAPSERAREAEWEDKRNG